MCIIVYKPRGIALPEEEKLKTCFDSNDDGAGFAWFCSDENLWHVEKGFMTWNDFSTRWKEHQFTADHTLIAHFRIGTAGNKDAGNTHPFPITSVLEDMRCTSFKCAGIACHNGVVGAGTGIFNDSMVHIRDYVAPLWPYLEQERIPEIMDKVLSGSSKWIVTKNEKIWLFGSFNEHLGVKYSNFTHENPRRSVQSWSCGTGYVSGQGGYWKNGRRTTWTAVGHTDPKDDLKNHTTNDNKWEVFKKPKDIKKALARTARGNVGKLVGIVSESGTVQWTSKSRQIIKDEAPNWIVCPSCFEDKNIKDSPYNVGDSICETCGAVFMDGTGQVVLYDLEIKKGEIKRMTAEDRQRIINGIPDEDLYTIGMY